MTEREQAVIKYNDAVAEGKTAVMSTLVAPTNQNNQFKAMLRVMLGNFPPHSKAYLRAFCSQKLEFEDQSYCFRLPMAFVPTYMGDTKSLVEKGVSFKNQKAPVNDLTR